MVGTHALRAEQCELRASIYTHSLYIRPAIYRHNVYIENDKFYKDEFHYRHTAELCGYIVEIYKAMQCIAVFV